MPAEHPDTLHAPAVTATRRAKHTVFGILLTSLPLPLVYVSRNALDPQRDIYRVFRSVEVLFPALMRELEAAHDRA